MTEKKVKTPEEQYLYPGAIHPIYLDHMNEEGLLGHAHIIELVEKEQPKGSYIKLLPKGEKEPKEEDQEVYNSQEWIVEYIDVTELGKRHHCKPKQPDVRKIPFLQRIGIATSGSKNKEDKLLSSNLVDNFEIVPGWGQCF